MEQHPCPVAQARAGRATAVPSHRLQRGSFVKKLVSAVLAVAALSTTGCAGASFIQRPVIGATSLYASTAAPETITDNSRVGDKSGEACATSILGLVTTGSATAAEAAKKA